MQLRRHSFLEACLNTASGFIVSFAATFVVFPYILGIETSAADNLIVTVFFTLISVVRSYLWRRAFNCWEYRYRYMTAKEILERKAAFDKRPLSPELQASQDHIQQPIIDALQRVLDKAKGEDGEGI